MSAVARVKIVFFIVLCFNLLFSGVIDALDYLDVLESLEVHFISAMRSSALDCLDVLEFLEVHFISAIHSLALNYLDVLEFLEPLNLQYDAECGAYGDVVHAFR